MRPWRKKIIIAIHGAGNKPPQPLIRRWWRKAICEGLARIDQPRRRLKFEMVYWAKFLYSEPLNIDEQDPDSPLFIDSPYVPATPKKLSKPHHWLRKRVLDVLEIIMDKLMLSENRFFNFDRLSDYVIRKKFRDLELYYYTDPKFEQIGAHARRLIHLELMKALEKHRKKDILLIAHSMGSVIAYDTLSQHIGRVKIHTLLTLGSPLGLPTFLKKIFKEQHQDYHKDKMATTPANIKQAWVNAADLQDTVALNYRLRNDFKPNSKGVAPSDIIVENDYEYREKENHHKIFGYLRAPEVAQVIHEFLQEGKQLPLQSIAKGIRRFFRKSLSKVKNENVLP